MTSRFQIILSVLATTAILSAPAQARYTAPVDIAAIPAYPTEQVHRTAYRPSRAASRSAERRRMARTSRDAVLARPEPRQGEMGSGIVRSLKTGVIAHVAAQYAGKFQGLLNDLESAGATIYYMGGIRPGRCSLGSQHPCGWALDICQDYRGHVSGARDCHLPHPAEFHAMVRAHGLYDGSVWCHGDFGHVQVKDSGGCNIAAHGSWGHGCLASMTGTIRFSARHRRHHHRIRYARR